MHIGRIGQPGDLRLPNRDVGTGHACLRDDIVVTLLCRGSSLFTEPHRRRDLQPNRRMRQKRGDFRHLHPAETPLQFGRFPGHLTVSRSGGKEGRSVRGHPMGSAPAVVVILGLIGLITNMSLESEMCVHVACARAARKSISFLQDFADAKPGDRQSPKGIRQDQLYIALMALIMLVGLLYALTIILKQDFSSRTGLHFDRPDGRQRVTAGRGSIDNEGKSSRLVVS